MERRTLVKAFVAVGTAAGLGAAGMLGACRSRSEGSVADSSLATAAKEGGPLIQVYKSPTCGCCGQWVEHLRGTRQNVERSQNNRGARQY